MIMSEKKSFEEIHRYWQDAADTPMDDQGLRPVARDPYLQQAVENAILPLLSREASVLDFGCGDGLSTVRFARSVRQVTGVDYIDRFVERARETARDANISNVSFLTGDVLNLQPVRDEVGPVDVAISIRCLINLNSWERQKQALDEISSCIKPGGLYLLSEGWTEGMNGLNTLREKASMDLIRTVDYNLLIDRDKFEQHILRNFKIEKYVGIGFYLLMSRILQPFISYPNPPRHDHPINKLAALLQTHCPDDGLFDEYDYAGVYVLRKL